jgi:hypothetical protein
MPSGILIYSPLILFLSTFSSHLFLRVQHREGGGSSKLSEAPGILADEPETGIVRVRSEISACILTSATADDGDGDNGRDSSRGSSRDTDNSMDMDNNRGKGTDYSILRKIDRANGIRV